MCMRKRRVCIGYRYTYAIVHLIKTPRCVLAAAKLISTLIHFKQAQIHIRYVLINILKYKKTFLFV